MLRKKNICAPVADEPDLEAIFRTIDELVELGIVVRVEEIDPANGELRWRYFHRMFAPKPN
jgi:hypothetical protein